MNNPLLETKELRIEYGESAENWVVNKVNSLNLPNWDAYILNNRDSAEKNHKEGDIVLKYKLDNGNKVLIYIDVKSATDTYDYPVIKTDTVNMTAEKYFKGVNHNFYLGIGKYNKTLENNTNIEFPYSLGVTKTIISKMLANDCEFINKYQKPAKDGTHFISMRYFVNPNDKSFMPIGKRTTLKGVLDIIEQYILNNKDKNIFKIEQ